MVNREAFIQGTAFSFIIRSSEEITMKKLIKVFLISYLSLASNFIQAMDPASDRPSDPVEHAWVPPAPLQIEVAMAQQQRNDEMWVHIQTMSLKALKHIWEDPEAVAGIRSVILDVCVELTKFCQWAYNPHTRALLKDQMEARVKKSLYEIDPPNSSELVLILRAREYWSCSFKDNIEIIASVSDCLSKLQPKYNMSYNKQVESAKFYVWALDQSNFDLFNDQLFKMFTTFFLHMNEIFKGAHDAALGCYGLFTVDDALWQDSVDLSEESIKNFIGRHKVPAIIDDALIKICTAHKYLEMLQKKANQQNIESPNPSLSLLYDKISTTLELCTKIAGTLNQYSDRDFMARYFYPKQDALPREDQDDF